MAELKKTIRELAGTGQKSKGRGMRRNSVIQIVVVLPAVLAPVLVIGRSEQNHVEVERVRISHVAGDHAHALRTPLGRSLSAPGSPAKLSFTHLSVADGLSNADVRAIAQDQQGFMWFGTWRGGLNRYDGYSFKVYKHDDQDQRSLIVDNVVRLHVDHTGVLWISTTGGGLDRYDRDTDSFTHFRHDPHDPDSLPNNDVESFYEDETGTLWAGTLAGLSRFDRTRGKFFTYGARPNDPASVGKTIVRSIHLDATTGMLWVGTQDEGVRVLDRSTGHFTSYANDPNDRSSLSSNTVVDIFQDRAGAIWLSTPDGLNRFDPQAHRFIRYLHDPRNPASLSDDFVTMACEDRAGRFWVATNNGLNLMDRARGTFTRYLHDPDDSSSLSGNAINWGGLYVDASSALWIGTRSTGVDRLAGGPARFTTYRHNSQGANSPSNNAITALAMGSAGALWIGTEAGLDRFDGRTFTHYLANSNDPSSLSPGPQREVAQDSQGAVWTGTYGGGLDRLEGQQVTHFRHDPKNSDSPANDNIASLVADTVGGLWIGVHGKGMDYFDGRHFTHFAPNPADPAGLPDAYVLPLLLDRHGMLWIGTARWGLVRFDTHTRKFTTYLMDPNQPGSQAVNWTEDVYSDGTSLWVASSTGLFRFDPETGKFTRHYTEKDGLANNTVVAVLGDAQGNLWISTANGLSRFDPRTETFRNYDMFDGLQGDAFSPHCHAKARDGRLFFGGVNGLSAFYPDKLADNPTPPPVVLTEFELFNKPVKVGGTDSPLRQAVNVASSLTLRYDQSVFRFQFAALDFTSPQKNRYAYKLEGFDRDWQYTDATRRFATYTHLDPADYTFRVKASNNDGVWNEQGVALHIRILPPWWKTWWFRALCVAIFLAVLWAAYQFRVRQLQRESKQLRDVIDTIPGYVWSARPDGSVDFINRRWLEFSGVSLENALGRGWEAAVHPDDLARFMGDWRTAVASGEAMESEARVRRADGHYRWLLVRNVPQRDQAGKIVKWYGTSADIDDRKRAEETLREQANLLDLTHDTIFVADMQGVIKYWNRGAEEQYGWTAEQAVGTVAYELLKTVFPTSREEIIVEVTRAGRWEGELLHTRKDGTRIVVACRLALQSDEQGAPVAILESNNDITDRKRAEEERERLRQLEADLAHINRVSILGELAASIAHEVNQPLSGVVSNGSACLRWLARDVPNLEEAREGLNRIVRDGKRAAEVIARIRALSKRAAAARDRLDLNETIQDVLALVGDEAKRTSVRIQTQFADDLSPVAGDRVQLQQVLLNLVMNGIQAMNSVGDRARELVITTRNLDPDQVEVTVEDSGIGLDPDIIGKIFDPFYTTKPGGMGMGLSISRSILVAHGGRLWATAKDGTGAIFYFMLPKYHEDESHAGVAAV